MKIRWRVVGMVATIIALGVIAVAGLRIGRRLSFFRVTQVEVLGARYLDEADIARRLNLRSNATTLEPLDDVRKAAAAVPGVLGATVERRLPNTLRITVREAEPVALVPLNDHLALVDSAGRVLPFDPVRAPTSLPIAGRDSVTPGLLGRVMRTDPVLFAAIESAHLDRGDVLLEFNGHRIRLRPQADADVLGAVTEVLRYLASHSMVWREVDARYRLRVFVQKGTA